MTPGRRVTKKYSVVDQRDAIRKINETTKLLKQELSIEYRESREVLSPSKRSTLEQLQQQSAMFSRKIEAEKKKLQQLEQDITSKTLALQANRENAGSIDEKRANAAADSRRMAGFENRLEKCLVKKNEAESENKTFLAKVETVRKDRVVFDSIYKTLEKEVFDFTCQYKRAAAELERVEALKQRALEELIDLQQYGQDEQVNYDRNFMELKKAIDHTQSEVAENIRQVESIPQDKHISGCLSTEEEKQINRRAAKALWNTAVGTQLIEYSQHRIEEYQEAFEQIAKATSIAEPNEFVTKLVALDEENFTKFKYLEELNQEIKELDTEIEKISTELEQSKTREGIATNFQGKAHVRKLNSVLQDMSVKNQALDAEYETFSTEMGKVKTNLHTIYNILAHNSSRSTNDDTFATHGVTDSNLIEFLGCIERFTTEMLMQDNKGQQQFIGEGPIVMATPSRQLSVVLPTASEVDEEATNSDEPRPLTHSELLQSAQEQEEGLNEYSY